MTRAMISCHQVWILSSIFLLARGTPSITQFSYTAVFYLFNTVFYKPKNWIKIWFFLTCKKSSQKVSLPIIRLNFHFNILITFGNAGYLAWKLYDWINSSLFYRIFCSYCKRFQLFLSIKEKSTMFGYKNISIL